jgi:hypothetical protein
LSEEKKKRREGEAGEPEEAEGKAEREEALGIGRLLGVIARRNPDLYRAIVQIKEIEGRKITDIVEEALEMYVEFKTSFAIMPRELFYALRIIDFISTRSMEQLSKVLQILATMMQFLVGYGGYGAEEVEERAEKAEKKAGVPAEVRAKLLDAMMPILQSIISLLVQTVTRATLPPQLQQQVAASPFIPIPKKVKVVSSAVSSAKQETSSSSASFQ